MRRARHFARIGLGACAFSLVSMWVAPASAQEPPPVPAKQTRPLVVEGIVLDARVADLLGLARIHFQGLIASELSAVGYRVVPPQGSSLATPSLVLVGLLKEEICGDVMPLQCHVAIQWELQERTGLVVYRTTTRAVEQHSSLEKLRRGLIQGALRSLLGRRRFALRLIDPEANETAPPAGELGFKQCLRPAMPLPQAARASAASVVLVESGSSLLAGTLLSGDGLVVTAAGSIEPDAPLRVRFSAQQVLPARMVLSDSVAGVALLHVAARTDSTCAPLRTSAIGAQDAVFGVSSSLSEDAAISLTGSVVLGSHAGSSSRLIEVDARVARSEGAPLFDEQGRLTALVAHDDHPQAGHATARPIQDVLSALRIRPAPISDPRLVAGQTEAAPVLGYVRDPDDPPFALTRSYTYGTSAGARQLRSAGFVGAGIGAAGVALTWLSFPRDSEVSAAERNKAVFWNDLSWVTLGLGACAVGASFVWPQSHDLVDARSSARRELFIGVGASGLGVRGRL